MLYGIKVVTCEEIERIEKLAFAHGQTPLAFMTKAGESFAALTEDFITKNNLPPRVYVMAGKGNNGGDAYATALFLLKKKIKVEVFSVFSKENCSHLCKLHLDQFEQRGGKVYFLKEGELPFFEEPGVILDGLLGTGFHGTIEGILEKVILHLNQSGIPILTLDIPSGLDGTTGKVSSVAIEACQTFYLEFPKIGFFLKEGWNHVGSLKKASFGLPSAFANQVNPSALMLMEEGLHMPKIKRNQHKYEAGYVLGLVGSKTMPGAAYLSSLAALRAGAGIVRIFSSPGMETNGIAPEIIQEKCQISRILEECQRAQALFVGPGLGRDANAKRVVSAILTKVKKPFVLDADALYFLANFPKLTLPATTILTPHYGEMERLLINKEVNLENCQAFVDKKNIILVLKGAPTFLFAKDKKPLILTRGDPGMATAGSGDVLTGILGALLAKKIDSYIAAALGILLHGFAGEKAALQKTSFSMIASDMIDHLSTGFNILDIPTHKFL